MSEFYWRDGIVNKYLSVSHVFESSCCRASNVHRLCGVWWRMVECGGVWWGMVGYGEVCKDLARSWALPQIRYMLNIG